MEKSKESTNLMDTHNRLIAEILTRYRDLIMCATIQSKGQEARPETIAVAGILMKIEFDGLFSAIKELLALSRRLKELWVFGSLGERDGRATAQAEKIDADTGRVAELFDQLEAMDMRNLAEKHGGTWERMGEEESRKAADSAPDGILNGRRP